MTLLCVKNKISYYEKCPGMNQGVHSEFHKSFQQVCSKKIKNCSCDVTNVLKKVVQISCPTQQNEISCGLFAVVICWHIFEGTQIGPHIFTQHEITKLRTHLLSLLVRDRNERYYGVWSIIEYLPTPMPSLLPAQGVLPRSPLGGVELPQTIKLIAGGSFVGNISFKATRFHKTLLYGNLFDSSSSEDESDPEITSVTLTKFTDDNQDIAQYSETSDEGDSSSYCTEDTRTPSNMGTNKQMEDIVVAESDKDSGGTIPAETVLDSNTADDWKVEHTGSMEKLEDQFNKEVHIPFAKQLTTVKEKRALPLHIRWRHQ